MEDVSTNRLACLVKVDDRSTWIVSLVVACKIVFQIVVELRIVQGRNYQDLDL